MESHQGRLGVCAGMGLRFGLQWDRVLSVRSNGMINLPCLCVYIQ